MGLDSLMAIELKNRLEHDLKVTLPATLIFEYPTIHELAEYILHDLLGLMEKRTTDIKEITKPKHLTEDTEKLALLSEEELTKLLTNEIEHSKQRRME